MKSIVLTILLVLLGIVFGMVLEKYLQTRKKNAHVSSTFIESKLAECSDLTTCNLAYVDLVKFSEGSIPLLTKKSFSMIYQANIRAGVELNKAKVKVTPNTVTITLPDTEVQSIDVDTDTLRFYDEHLALLNWTNKEDISSAIAAAREDAQKNANTDKLKKEARTQAEKVISRLIAPVIDGEKQLIIV